MADEVRPASDVPRPGQAVPPVTDTPAPSDPLPAPDEPVFRESTSEEVQPVPSEAGPDSALFDRPADHYGSTPESATPPAPKRSAMPAVLAVIGLVLIALLAINLYMMANPPGNDAMPALQADVGALKQRVGALEAKPAPAATVAPVDDRVKALDDRVAKLSSDLEAVRQQASTAPAQAASSTEAATARLDALDKQVHDLDAAVGDLKHAVAEIPRPDLGPLQAKTADLQTAVDSLKAGLAAVPKVDLGPLESKAGALESRVGTLDGKVGALETRVAQQDNRIKPLESEYATTRTRAAPLALTAQAILQALDEGKPFAPEVAALHNLGAEDAKLAALRPVADKGAPTRDELVSGFAEVRGAILRASAPKVTGTMLDRVMASAQSIVKVRPTGSNPGNDPDAIASRIAADLDKGAFSAALDEWEHLPDASKAASASWAERLKQRVAAEDAARSIASGAIATLGSAP